MKKKHLFIAATALLAFASCADDGFVGDENAKKAATDGAISFNLNTPALTRAADKTAGDAAADLNNRFVIWGEKNEAGAGAAASDANLVFKNYKVEYTANTAYNTTSNTKNWEYVGLTPYTQFTPYLSTTQTIKYWDYEATKYTFTAVSALDADITSGKVVIAKNTTGASSSDFNKGYEIEVKTGASLDDIFVADRNVINQGTGKDRTATNAYGGNVTMRFRNFMSKIRFGIYETIPGYKVKITKVYYNSSNSTTNFGVDGKFLTVGDGSSTHTQFTVTYEDPSNKAVVNVKSETTPASGTYFETAKADGSFPKTTVPFLSATEIGTTAPTATFNKAVQEASESPINTGVYTTVLPFTSNDANIKLKIDFQLISEDTGETIDIADRTAEVPAAYCQWKSNYAYTYIFKINDDNLYPITFDAVEVVDENGTAEYITTVTEPSITTFGVKDSKYSTGKDEYVTGTDIYATFVANHTVQTPSLTESTKANYVQIYQVTSSDPNYKITEASVAERLAETPLGSAKLTCTNVTTSSDGTYFTNTKAPSVESTVPAEDGTTKTIKAVKLPGAKTNTYAIEYVTYDAGTALTTEQSKVGYYSKSGDVYTLQDDGTGDNSTLYYKQIKTYKVIKVVAE